MPRKKENPNQLKMFMTAREIISEYKPLEGDYINEETADELWERKANESETNGLLESIRKHGVQIPVSLDHADKEVLGGHHRIAAQYRLNPDQFMPVNYETNPWATKTYEAVTEALSDVPLPEFSTDEYHYERF